MKNKTFNLRLTTAVVTTFVVASVFSVVSCTKNNTEATVKNDPPASGHVSLGSTTNWSAASNASNPHDDVGLKHNLALKYITDNLTIDDMYVISDDYDNAVTYARTVYPGVDVDDVESNITHTDISNVLNGFNDCCDPTAQELKDMLPLGTSAKAYVGNLIDALLNSGSDPDFTTFMTTVTNWEGDITNQGLSSAEETALYMYGSTLRYSYYAWINAELPEYTSENVQLKTTRLFKWIATALFDAGGAAIGSGLGPAGAVIAGAACSAGAFAVCSYNGW